MTLLTDAHARAVDRIVIQAATDPAGTDEDRVRRALAHVRWAMPGMLTSLTAAVHDGRSGARAEARDDLATHVHPDALERRREGADGARAYAAAAGLVSAWGATTLFKIGQWRAKQAGGAANSNGRPLAAEIRDTTKLLEKRIQRTAATETVHAFNETRSAIMVAHADAHDAGGALIRLPRRDLFELPPPGDAGEPAPPGRSQGPYRDAVPAPPHLRPLKVWSAILDGHVCPVCRAMHGTVVDPRDEFPGGDPPRHPFCRCIPVIIMTTLSANEVEQAYEQLAA